MPQSIEWPPPHQSRPGRRRRFFLILLALAILFFGTRAALSYYVDLLWFKSLGYESVFWKTLNVQWGVFAAMAAATFAILYGSFLALKRAHLDDLPDGHTIFIGTQPVKLPVEPVLKFIALVASLAISLVSAATLTAEWQTLALFWYAPHASEVVDPIFGKPLNFYLFALPAWQIILGWLLTLAVILCAVAIFFVFASGGARMLAGRLSRQVTLPWRGFSIAFGCLLLILAANTYLSRFDRLLSDHTIFGGVTYTDAHVSLMGLLVVCVALVVGALTNFVNAVRGPRGSWLMASVVPAVVCYLGFQVIAWYMGSFIVKPNELVREKPYITYNTEFTQQAYGLSRVTQREFPDRKS